MELLLNFMYSGEVGLKQDVLENFLKTGDELGVKGLTGTTDTESTIERVSQATPMQDNGGQNEENLQNRSAEPQMEAFPTTEIQAPNEQDQGDPKSMETEEVDRRPNIISNILAQEGETDAQVMVNEVDIPPGKLPIPRLASKNKVALPNSNQTFQVSTELSLDKLPFPKIASKQKIPATAPKQVVQIVKTVGGMHQVRGLLPGQKLVRISNGKLCILSCGNVSDKGLSTAATQGL